MGREGRKKEGRESGVKKYRGRGGGKGRRREARERREGMRLDREGDREGWERRVGRSKRK